MGINLSLPLRKPAELDARIAKGEILTREALAAYLPTKEDYDKVRGWLVSQGFNVTLDATTRHAVFVRGSVAKVASSLKLKMARVATPDGEYSSAISPPELPDQIASAVSSIHGLQPHLVRHAHALPVRNLHGVLHVFPADVALAYKADPSLTGTGQTIAIVGGGHASVSQTDVEKFWSLCGITNSWQDNVKEILVGYLPVTREEDRQELTMDVEWASGIAPGAKIRVYETGYTNDSSTEAAYAQILNDLPDNPSIHQVTESYGSPESEHDPYGALVLLAAQGVTCFASSGDAGSRPSNDWSWDPSWKKWPWDSDFWPSRNIRYNQSAALAVEYPASDPHVVAVGGTTCVFNDTGTLDSPEYAWGLDSTGMASGGGISSIFDRPSWQVWAQSSGIPIGSTKRVVPDVSAMAYWYQDPNDPKRFSGVPLVVYNYQPPPGEQGIGASGGTSLASPIWAGLCALVNQALLDSSHATAGFLAPKLYAAKAIAGTACLNDIVTGRNGADEYYSSGPGYNPCTGLGTPNITNLVKFIGNGVSSVSILEGEYKTGDVLAFWVTFSESVFVDTAGGVPCLTIVLNGKSVSASYSSGSGTNALIFNYTVQDGDYSSGEIGFGPAILLNGGRIGDGSGLIINPALGNSGSVTGVKVGNALVGWWKLDGDAVDSSGNGNHGAAVGGVTFVSGVSGQAANFAGGYIEIPNSPTLNLTSALTLSLWVKQGDVANAANGTQSWRLVDKISAGASDGWMFAYYGGAPVIDGPGFDSGNHGHIAAVGGNLSNQWIHLALTYDRGQTLFYVNGTQVGSATLDSVLPVNALSLLVGNAHGQNVHFDGQMDDLRIYNRAISAAEIVQLFSAAQSVNAVILSNVTARLVPGKKVVTITYDLAEPQGRPCDIALQISRDGGLTWENADTLTGDFGANVAPGNGKMINWNAGADWPAQSFSQASIRLTATHGQDGSGVIVSYAHIPAGTYTMGSVVTSNTSDVLDGISDATPHQVTLSSFYISRALTTKADWDDIRIWGATHSYTDLSTGAGKAPTHPVVSVSWYDVVKWCNAKSEKEGLVPAYYTDDAQTMVYRTGNVDVTNVQVKWFANGYRLPTEAEWEYAARGGLAGKRFPWGDTITQGQANYYSEASPSYDLSETHGWHPIYGTGHEPFTSPEGSFPANGYGLFDMAGNVYEWCWDWYGSYGGDAVNAPLGATSGTLKVFRGGCYGNNQFYARTALRSHSNADNTYGYYAGFRPVRTSLPLTSSAEYAIGLDLSAAGGPSVNVPVRVQTPLAGQNVQFSVGASGVGALSYQWSRNGVNIPGAITSSLSLDNVNGSAAGYYLVRVTDDTGATISAPMFLNIAYSHPRLVGWGSNAQGQLSFPADAGNVVAISARFWHTLALLSDGTVRAWGTYYNGTAPTPPPNLTGVVAIAAGPHHDLALKSDGTVVAWGTSPTVAGRLDVPVGLSNVVAISAGTNHSVALKSDGTVVTWGVGDVYDAHQLDLPANTPPIAKIAAGGDFTIALTREGKLVGWGGTGPANSFGQGSPPANLGGIVAIAAGGVHGLALDSSGQVSVWGTDPSGISGLNKQFPINLTNIVAIATDEASLALRQDGTIVAWGWDASGQSTAPQGISNAVAVAKGQQHSVVLVGFAGGSVESYFVTTLAGSPLSPGSANGTGNAARFNQPYDSAIDGSGNLFVADLTNNTIRKITSGGVVTTVAGTPGAAGWVDATGAAARFDGPTGLAVDGSGNLFVSEYNNHTIRKITPDGVVTTLAGTARSAGSADGTGSDARFYQPEGIVVDSSGNVFVADHGTTLRKITPGGVVTTVAGMAGSFVWVDGTGTAARFYGIGGLALDSAGNLFATDQASNTIRKITPDGVVTTIVGMAGSAGSVDGTGNAARFNQPTGIAVDGSGNLFVTDVQNHTIRKITAGGVVTTIAGAAGVIGSADGPGSDARFNQPVWVEVDSNGNLFVSDMWNHTIRKLSVSYKFVPEITKQSAPRQVVAEGQSLSLSVSATGAGTLSYRWTHNGLDILGATSPALSLANVTRAANGYYLAHVTDANGTSISKAIFVMVVPANPHVIAWGRNDFGQATVPLGLSGVVAVAAQNSYSLALKDDGSVVAWGSNAQGELAVPSGLTNVVAISAGEWHALALRADGTVVAWGDNSWGSVPVPADLADVVEVAACGAHSLALKADGKVVAWGYNAFGQTNVPADLTNAVSLGGGGHQSVVLKSDGTVVAWGNNVYNQGTVPPELIGVAVASVSARGNHNLALKADGTVVPWGENAFGQSTLPNDLGSVASIETGLFNSLAVRSNGTVEVWGRNDYGQCDVPFGLSHVVAAATSQHILALVDAPLTAPAFSTPPADRSMTTGADTSFNVVATGDPAPTIRWQVSADNSATWSDIANGGFYTGADTSLLTITGGTMDLNGYRYRALASNILQRNLASDSATLVVSKRDQLITFGALSNRSYGDAPFELAASATSGLLVSFSWVSGPASISNSTVTLTGVGDVTVRALQAGDTNYNPAPAVERSFSVGGNYASWQQGKFTAGQLSDASFSGPAADPDADGISNLLEYALAREPKTADRAGVPSIGTTVVSGQKYLTLTYTHQKPATAPDLTYTVAASNDLVGWSPLTPVALATVDQGTSESVSVRDTVPIGTTRGRFLRLSVSTQSTTATTPPVGAVTLPTLANSDTLVSVPLARPSVYQDKFFAVNGTVLTVTGAPGWTANQFVKNLPTQANTYYVQLKTGSAAGHFYTVTANAASTLTVDWNGETPSVAAGDQFELIPYWSLGTLYPPADAGVSFTNSINAAVRSTELIFPDLTYVGINPPTAATYYFASGVWHKVGAAAATSFSDLVLTPDSYFVQRNKAAASQLTTLGTVVTGPLATLLSAQGGTGKQDNPVALRFAGAVTLAQSNLVGSGVFQSSVNAALRKDELLVFDNTTNGINKSVAATYYYSGGAWRKVGASASADFGTDAVFTPGTGVILRKAGTGAGNLARDSFWIFIVNP